MPTGDPPWRLYQPSSLCACQHVSVGAGMGLVDSDGDKRKEAEAFFSGIRADILRQFYADVCAEAETIMAQTNTVSGAHWNAMKRVLKRRGVEVE